MNGILTDVACAISLQLERDAAEALLVILQKEQQALVEGTVEHLEALASDKAQVVRQVTELTERRHWYLVSHSSNPDRKGMQAWITGSANANATAAWRDLLQLTKTAQQLNRINGEMIAARLQRNQQAFSVLQEAAGAATLYGPAGHTLGFGGGRPLGCV